ncbi:hypothetical protein AHMF7605_07640 [Adhaeribacter arboris]|uniref:Uncharacterized protein n=1 Tax=Adhaeribacter arboris TaxID=2072846 RepID=A0A2T2YD23_9BACT|nr:hypothetical protein [Adhaeribacter arboris]PSR53409.1 hypothetical protein AHMF7605_07640 [Adhaeribacter arboris]
MNVVNKIIAGLYQKEQASMQFSGGKARLFIAKCVFCLLIWIWLLPVFGILENNLGIIEISFQKPSHRIGYLPILLLMYFILNYFTAKVNEIDVFLVEEENREAVKKARKLFLLLIVLGFIFLVIIAKYNEGNPLSD